MDTVSKIKKDFFKSEKEREIWVKVNAELIQYRNKMIGVDKPMGSINERNTCMWVSNNQLIYDEFECPSPRFSLEELITLSIPGLFRLATKREEEEMLQIFNQCEKEWLKENERKRKKGNG
jgi:hypothetical protein